MTTKIVSIAHNAITAKLIDASREVKLEVQKCLSYQVDGFEQMGAFKGGGWDGRSNFLSFTEGTFPRGFVHHVQAHLIRCGYNVKIIRKPYPAPLGPENPIVDDFPEDPRYDYQMQVVDKLIRHGQVIAMCATGSGKSRIAKLATARINRPTLFLTTRGVLMYQMAESFRYLDKNVAILGDGNLQISKITCGMVQTIISWLKEPDSTKDDKVQLFQAARRRKMVEALEKFEFVILEEAHETSGNSFYEIMRHCKNAHYRLALTATPFMKDSEEANMRLMASSGPVAIKVSEKLLIDRGILAKPYFKFVELKEKPEKLYKTTPWRRAYKLGITDNVHRNKLITIEALRAARYGLTVMILVLQKEHGKTLKRMVDSVGLKSAYIFGEDKQKARKDALKSLEKGEINVLIGSSILDVGVDVPSVGMVILAGGGKAEVGLRQRIGRGAREKKNGFPNVFFVVDFADVHNDTLRSHYRQRRAIIENTEGFGENIVADFNFAGLGLVRKAA
jgi:superfamily II DNA or RNA helicase